MSDGGAHEPPDRDIWVAGGLLGGGRAGRTGVESPSHDDRMHLDWRQGVLRITRVDAWAEPLVVSFVPDIRPELTVTVTTTRTGQVRGSGGNLSTQSRRVGSGTRIFADGAGLRLGWQNRHDDVGFLTGYAGSATEHFSTWTVAFSKTSTGEPTEVSGLGFALGDIDFGGAPVDTGDPPGVPPLHHRENVVVVPQPDREPERGRSVVGKGVDADPWVSTHFDEEAWVDYQACTGCPVTEKNALWNRMFDLDSATDDAGSVVLDYGASRLRSVTVKAWSENPRVDTQEILLSPLVIDYPRTVRSIWGAGRR